MDGEICLLSFFFFSFSVFRPEPFRFWLDSCLPLLAGGPAGVLRGWRLVGAIGWRRWFCGLIG